MKIKATIEVTLSDAWLKEMGYTKVDARTLKRILEQPLQELGDQLIQNITVKDVKQQK